MAVTILDFPPTTELRQNDVFHIVRNLIAGEAPDNIPGFYDMTLTNGSLEFDASNNVVIVNNLLIGSSGDILVNTDKFTVDGATGDTDVGGVLSTGTGGINVNSGKFVVSGFNGGFDAAGNCVIFGELNVHEDLTTRATTVLDGYDLNVGNGDIILNTDKFTADGSTGSIAVNTDKFTVDGATGDTDVGGKLDVADDFSVNTDKFTVEYSTGHTVIAGMLDIAFHLTVNTDKFIVESSTGNTTIAGVATIAGKCDVNNQLDVDASIAGDYAGSIHNANTFDGDGLDVSVNHSGTSNVLTARSAVGNSLQVKANGQVKMPNINSSGSAGNPIHYNPSDGDLYEYTSSKRFKANIRELELETSKVFDIQPTSYERLDNEGNIIEGYTEHGPIAEDVAAIDPNFATYDADGKTPRGLERSHIMWAMLEEMKKLKSKNDELESRIEALENK